MAERKEAFPRKNIDDGTDMSAILHETKIQICVTIKRMQIELYNVNKTIRHKKKTYAFDWITD
jgi:hypothetical protein